MVSRRVALAVLGSAALHGSLFGLSALVRGPSVKMSYEIDVLDAPPAPSDDPRGDARASRAAARARRIAGEHATLIDRPAEPEAPPDGGAPAPLTDVGPLAPASARLVVLIRTDRLRQTPLAEATRTAIGVLPDGAWAIASGLDPVTDFDALLVATSNPLDVTQTFLAARLADEAKVRERFRAPGGADPRTLVYPAPHVAVLGRPEHLSTVTGPWLRKLGRFAEAPGGEALVEVSANGLHGGLNVGGIEVPLPQTGRARLSWPPAVKAELHFDDPGDAERLASRWPALSARVESSTLVRLLGLGGATADARVEAQGGMVTLDAPLKQRHLEAISTLMRLFIDRAQGRPGAPRLPIQRVPAK